MSKPLPTQNTFNGLAPPWSLSNLDSNFTSVWAAIDDIGTYSNTLSDTGLVNALVATSASGITFSLAAGIAIEIVVANTSTSTTPTLNINATGAKTITNADGTALNSGALVANGIYRLVYDGTNYRVLNPTNPVGRGIALVSYKVTATSRNNTTTLAIDPNLQVNLPASGIYAFQFSFALVGALSGGFQAQVQYSGTFSGNSLALAHGLINGAVYTQSANLIGTTLVATAATAADWLTIFGSLTVTGTGALALWWAQNSSNAANTTVQAGSFMTVTQLS